MITADEALAITKKTLENIHKEKINEVERLIRGSMSEGLYQASAILPSGDFLFFKSYFEGLGFGVRTQGLTLIIIWSKG